MTALGLMAGLTLIGVGWLLVTWWLARSTRADAAAPAVLDVANRLKSRFPAPLGPVNPAGALRLRRDLDISRRS